MKSVFLSRPNDVTKEQDETIMRLTLLLEDRQLQVRTIGKTDFPNKVPLQAVEELVRECSGIIVLGLPQQHIKSGIMKEGTCNQKIIANAYIPTPWNHIEASMAYMLKLPMLIIKDMNIEGGVFDIGVSSYYIHRFNLNTQEWMNEQSFKQPFNTWCNEVQNFAVSSIVTL